MPEDHSKPIHEIYIRVNDQRHRVYRGRNVDHVAWKMQAHRNNNPEHITLPVDPGDLLEKP